MVCEQKVAMEVVCTNIDNHQLLESSPWCWYWLPLSHSLPLRSTKRLTCITAPLNNVFSPLNTLPTLVQYTRLCLTAANFDPLLHKLQWSHQ
ncbi:hypothetical protein E2C01_079537 [Portunus trituberculatus]|uniref:Uncharacterized protein n=1 Tax=Portunus trituberculatus TaxID=210409 RepID=A0A5B7ITL6_PORTR|nr:hypothetical protein [Portunus trituberculatus]